MFNVQFYNIKKKQNSLYRPSTQDSPILNLNCNLKDECSVLKPVLLIASAYQDFNPTNCNYCRIDAFDNRYYFVKWEFNIGLWEAHCTIDALASWKDELIEHPFYFTRTSTASDGDIVDKLYPAKATPQVSRVGDQFWYAGTYSLGVIVMTVIGNDAQTQFFQMDPVQFALMTSAMFGTIEWANLEGEISEQVAKLVTDPFHYITSVKWFPVGSPNVGEELTSIHFGYWEVGVSECYQITDASAVAQFTETVNLNPHPQAATRGTFLNHEPYLTAEFFMPSFGRIKLDMNDIAVGTPLNITVQVDHRSGKAELQITQNGNIKAYSTAMIACDVPLNDVSVDVPEVVTQGVSGALAAIATNFIGALTGLGNALEAAGGRQETKGAQGSVMNYNGKFQIVEYAYLLVDEDNADNGRPYCKNGTMENLGEGFYVAENGNVAIMGAYKEELDIIKDSMETGVYYQI